MKQRIKKVARIARWMEHQKEAIEMEVLQTRNRFLQEESHLTGLEKELQGTFDTFEKRVLDRESITLQEVSFLYGIHASLSRGIEKKRNQVSLIAQELETQKGFLLEAYQKKEVFGLFQNKMILQEQRETALGEQQSLDFLNLINGNRK